MSSLRFRSVEGNGVAGHGDAAANELHLGIAEQPVVPPAEVVPGPDPERAVVLFARPARELSGTLYQAWAAASLPTQLDRQLIAESPPIELIEISEPLSTRNVRIVERLAKERLPDLRKPIQVTAINAATRGNHHTDAVHLA